MLSQLSYTPLGIGSLRDRDCFDKVSNRILFRLLRVGVPELESGTSSLSATRSNQLSYTPFFQSEGPTALLQQKDPPCGKRQSVKKLDWLSKGRTALSRTVSAISLTKILTLSFGFEFRVTRITDVQQRKRLFFLFFGSRSGSSNTRGFVA